jgi:hypothetical protein
MRGRRLATALALIALVTAAAVPIADAAAGGSQGAAQNSSLLDCNGYGAAKNPDHPVWRCPDPRGSGPDEPRFEDNGHYIGHDEPAIQFFSTTPGSGNSARYNLSLPSDPSAIPNGTVAGPVWNFQTHIAPWFGMVMCDTESFPETRRTCVPDSDSNNIPMTPTPDHAGTAFMELQFYPPGYAPHISCDQVHWCVALTMTSLQGNFDFSVLNNKCVEPQAFAFVTKSGKPIGPTGPDNANTRTFTPTPDVLLMNRGDQIRVSMHDTPDGFFVEIADQTTGETGTMTAGAGNGWRHIIWDPKNFNCKGEPYTFHPMFDTAAPPYPNGQPRQWPMWTVHTYNVAMSDEIGHFETPDQHGDGNAEERPCYNGPYIRGCLGSDVDFDGNSYLPDWPDGDANHPGPWAFTSPQSRDAQGNWSSQISDVRFETDIPAIDFACNIITGAGCSVPPNGAAFYPWFHLITANGGCAWALSNDIPGQLNGFGGVPAAWGPLEQTDFGGGFIAFFNNASEVIDNPCP